MRTVAVAGIGFFTDSYLIFSINLVTSILGMVYVCASSFCSLSLIL
jgi:hypothetical protein